MINFFKRIYKYILVLPIFFLILAVINYIFSQLIYIFYESPLYAIPLDQNYPGSPFVSSVGLFFELLKMVVAVSLSVLASFKILKFSNKKAAFFVILIAYLFVSLPKYIPFIHFKMWPAMYSLMFVAIAFLVAWFVVLHPIKFKKDLNK